MDPTIIENPEKIGVGTWQISGQGPMFADLELVNANWFYTWEPVLLDSWFDEWCSGSAISIGGTEGDWALVLGSGSDAWAVQNVSLAAGGGLQLTLSFEATAFDGAAGGVTVEYLDASGNLLGTNYLEILDAETEYLTDLAAPVGTASGRIIAWSSSGSGIEIDDLSLLQGGIELTSNGGFESIGTLGGTAADDDFVPMIWGADDMKYVRSPGYLDGADALLTFNEPNHQGQANLSVSKALSYWPELMATGLRLGSPATTTSGTLGQGSWLQSFMSQADANGYRVDFIAVHYYTTDPTISKFKAFLEKVYAAYDRPIWVTEWALADWNNPGRFSAEQQMEFFKAGTLMMDDLAFVERHAWFGTHAELDVSNLNSELIGTDGSLTAVGSTFAWLADVIDAFAPSDILLSNATIEENAADGTSIGLARAVDETANDSFTYQLLDNAGGRFVIDAVTGELKVLDGAMLDYEQAESHDVTIRVTDSSGKSLDKTIAILLTDVGEAQIHDGTDGNDVFVAQKDDLWTINGLAGDDEITTLGGTDTIHGGAGNDVIFAGAGDDVIAGDAGYDTLNGGAGDDMFLIDSTSGTDTIDGGDGRDTISATQSGSVLYWRNVTGVEAVSGDGHDNVYIVGSASSDVIDLSLVALSGIRQIQGRGGNDTIIGSTSADNIFGGNGKDQLSGGEANDIFDFNSIGESKVGQADVVKDFAPGSDRIDLATIDASTTRAGNQAFSFIGEAAFTGMSGQLRIDTTQDGKTVIYGDIDGNKVADFQIELVGVHQLVSSDFVL